MSLPMSLSGSLPRSRAGRAALAALPLVALLAACGPAATVGTATSATSATTQAVPSPSTSVTPEPSGDGAGGENTDDDCTPGNVTRSYAPAGALPAPGKMPAGSHMRTIQDREKLIAGVSADTLLFGAANPGKEGRPIEGFDIDVLRAISQAIFGAPDRIEFRVITTAERIPLLESGDVDIVARNMTITCERWRRIAFSAEYYTAAQRLFVPLKPNGKPVADSPAELAAIPGQRVCASSGTTSLERLREQEGLTAVEAPTTTECLIKYQQGEADAITGDDVILAGFDVQDPTGDVAGDPLGEEPYGLGISAEHPEFVQFVNAVLERFADSGAWAASYRTWLEKPLRAGVPDPPRPRYGRPLPR